MEYLIRSAIEQLAGIHSMLAIAQERRKLPPLARLNHAAKKLRIAADYLDRIVSEARTGG